MRTNAALLAFAVSAIWSPAAGAQLQPPPPPQPGWGQPGWGPAPMQQPAPGWGSPPQSATQLNTSDNASSFRGFEIVYLNAEVGGAYVNIGDQFTSQGGQGGLALGLGAGLRFLDFTVGLRGRIAPLSAFTLIQANLELGIHVPEGAWDPYINLHGGYARASMNSQEFVIVTATSTLAAQVTPPSPSGGDFGGSLGTDYYLSALFSLGLDATLDALFLSTSGATLTFGNLSFPVAGQSNTGIAFIGSAHAGLHFDL